MTKYLINYAAKGTNCAQNHLNRGYFNFSKDMIDLISQNKEEILKQRVSLDDVTIGKYFYNKNIPLYDGATRTDIGDLPSTRERIMDLKCLLRHEYHYHMRHNLRGMNYLHSLYLDNKYCN
jgi:hypothetical protein